MIQAINTVNSTPIRKNNATSFGQAEYYAQQRPSKAKAVAKWTAREFVLGAAISLIIDGAANLLNKAVPKLGLGSTPLKSMLPRAAAWGGIWIAMGFVINGVRAMFANKNKA